MKTPYKIIGSTSLSLCLGLELVPDVFGRRHESAENDADEQDHEDAADVLQVELTHRRRALVLLQGAIKVLLSLKGL